MHEYVWFIAIHCSIDYCVELIIEQIVNVKISFEEMYVLLGRELQINAKKIIKKSPFDNFESALYM